MSQTIKPSVLWITSGVIILFFVINHWMSSEISRPAQTQQMTEPAPNDNPVEPQQSFMLPQVPNEEVTQEPVNTVQANPPTPKEGEKVYEPIYEPPSNDVILVQ